MSKPYQKKSNRNTNNRDRRPQGDRNAPFEAKIRESNGQQKTISFKSEWISEGIDREGILYTDKLGQHIKNAGLKSNQIRNIFGEVKRIQFKGDIKNEKRAFLLLKPKMAYAAKRARGTGMEELKKVLILAHEEVDFNNDNVNDMFERFVDFFEAILAYHKAHGGGDN